MKVAKQPDVNWLIVIVGVLAIGFSTFQTAIGYEDAVGSIYMSLILSLIISVSMIALLVALSKKVYYREQEGRGRVMILYLIFASASISANFNTVFSGFIKEDQLATAIDELEGKYVELQKTASQVIDDADGTSKIIKKAESLKGILQDQIMDPANPGYGDEAKKVAKQIADLFDIEEFSPPSGTPENQKNVITSQVDKVIIANTNNELIAQNKLQEAIENSVIASQRDFSNARETAKVADDEEKFKHYISEYNKQSSSLDGFVRDESLYSHEQYKSPVTEIGKIPYAISQAFKPDYKFYAIIAIIICLLIDLFVPMLVYAIGPKKKPKKRRRGGGAEMPERNPDDAKEVRMNQSFSDTLRKK